MKAMLCCLLLQLAVACGSVVQPADDDGGDDAGVSTPEIDAGPDEPSPDAGPNGPQPCVLGTSALGTCTL